MSIRQEVIIPARPGQVFEALTRSEVFSRMSGGAPAEIDARAGGAFSLFGGAIQGCNVECVAGERLVQAWRPRTWAAGHYSLVRFDLRPEGEGTHLTLEHVGYPEESAEHLAGGWQANYVDALRKLFA